MNEKNLNSENSDSSQYSKLFEKKSTENNDVPKTSRLAVTSTLCLIFTLVCVALELTLTRYSPSLGTLKFFLAKMAGFFILAAFVIGITARFIITRRKNLKGIYYANISIILGGLIILLSVFLILRDKILMGN